MQMRNGKKKKSVAVKIFGVLNRKDGNIHDNKNEDEYIHIQTSPYIRIRNVNTDTKTKSQPK